MKSQGRSVQIHDKLVRKSRPTPPRLFCLRNRVFLRPFRQLLVRGRNRETADADRRRRLPVPGLSAEDGECRATVIASVAKQSRATRGALDCFVADAPRSDAGYSAGPANNSRLPSISLTMKSRAPHGLLFSVCTK